MPAYSSNVRLLLWKNLMQHITIIILLVIKGKENAVTYMLFLAPSLVILLSKHTATQKCTAHKTPPATATLLQQLLHYYNYYHYYYRFMAHWTLSGTTRVSRYQKGNTNLDSLEQEIVSGSGISWAICKSALRTKQITMPASHQSVFLEARCPSYRWVFSYI